VTFKSEILGPFRSTISYIINENHIFKAEVIAIVELIILSVSKNNFRLQFQDENTEMFSEEVNPNIMRLILIDCHHLEQLSDPSQLPANPRRRDSLFHHPF